MFVVVVVIVVGNDKNFLLRDAVRKRGTCTSRRLMSICLSVCLSITLILCIKMDKDMRFSQPDSPITLVSSGQLVLPISRGYPIPRGTHQREC